MVGAIVASSNFLAHLTTLSQILSAILAVLLWPVVVLHIHVAFRDLGQNYSGVLT